MSDDVGYGKPPKRSRWKKGQSGNPKGRPRKKHTARSESPDPQLHLTVLDEGNRLVSVTENGRREELPLMQVVIRGLGVAAAKGNVRAMLAVSELYRDAEKQRLKDVLGLAQGTLAYKQRWAEEFARCDRAGRPRPNPVPHPDDMVINYVTGAVNLNGPRDAAESAVWDAQRRHRRNTERQLVKLFVRLKRLAKRQGELEAEIATDEIQVKVMRLEAEIEFVDWLYPSRRVRQMPGFDLAVWRETQDPSAQPRRSESPR